MNIPRVRLSLLSVIMWMLMLVLSGCATGTFKRMGETLDDVFKPKDDRGPTAISVKVPYKGKEVERMVAASGDAQCKNGVELLSSGKAPEAKAAFEAATQTNPSDCLAWYGHGVACELLKEDTLAAKSFESAVNTCKDDKLKDAFSTAFRQAKSKAGQQ